MSSPLTDDDIDTFIRDGALRLDHAFSRELCKDVSAEVLSIAGVNVDNPATWPGPVVRVDGTEHASAVAAINGPRLTSAVDQLVGVGRWKPRHGYGTFPIRFPSADDPGDAGWHIDGSFGHPPHYQVNLASRGRALLLLMLFTDVGIDDAPTRLKLGSHRAVARALGGRGDVTFFPTHHAPEALHGDEVHATGDAGTVWLCHPFVVHAATWPHRGQHPRVIAQPCIHHPEGEWQGAFDLNEEDAPPVVRAIQEALIERPLQGPDGSIALR